eukprot:Skav218876  [mRNA]  locus=scaffold2503:61464:64334:+ [translate_table: standard]
MQRLFCEACVLYLQGYLKECTTLPPDYISTLSFFFPVFPAYDAAVAFSCLEFFLEWRYLPDFKLWRPLILLGALDALDSTDVKMVAVSLHHAGAGDAGSQLALCNPVMLVLVAFVLWASLLHVTMEEEKELFDEFPGRYANYVATTSTWIPGFPVLLESSSFQREMEDNAPEDGPDMLEQEESEEEIIDEEDDLLPTWEGVRKGGALWNRQFQEPWRLG